MPKGTTPGKPQMRRYSRRRRTRRCGWRALRAELGTSDDDRQPPAELARRAIRKTLTEAPDESSRGPSILIRPELAVRSSTRLRTELGLTGSEAVGTPSLRVATNR